MLRLQLICISFISFFLFSCHSGTKNPTGENNSQTKDTVAPAVKENFPKGEIIEKVVCKSDASQSYAMYLPKNYSLDKTYPVVFAFDAHGTGKLPVSMYKELAEKYGYILIGSNNSKNGTAWEVSTNIAQTLLSDAQNRLSINAQRIYLMGFSGGARVANGVAISNGAVSGVICVGAAAPAGNAANYRSNYTWLGIAGDEDFNSTEMRKYDLIDLAGHNIKHALITFDGKHEWCKQEVMDEAFWWLELCEMRKNIKSKNDSLVKQKIAPVIKQIEICMQKKQSYEAYLLVKKTINFYDGLTDLTYCFNTYKTLQKNADVDKAMKDEELMWAKEDELKNFYLKGFESGDLEKWKKEIVKLNDKIKTGRNKLEVNMNKRVLGYLSLVAYMQSTGALKQNQIPAADYFCKIYVLVDPTNNEAHYLTADVNAKEGNQKEALSSLNKALANGFNDLPRLQSDSAFIGMQNTPEFLELVKKLGQK
jgi:dienelactone hydrolase